MELVPTAWERQAEFPLSSTVILCFGSWPQLCEEEILFNPAGHRP